MTNYYKQFEAFKKQFKLKKDDELPVRKFRQHIMIFFGFGKQSHHGVKTVDNWIDNFQEVGFIRLKKIRNTMNNDDNYSDDNWMVTILDGEKLDEKKECKV